MRYEDQESARRTLGLPSRPGGLRRGGGLLVVYVVVGLMLARIFQCVVIRCFGRLFKVFSLKFIIQKLEVCAVVALKSPLLTMGRFFFRRGGESALLFFEGRSWIGTNRDAMASRRGQAPGHGERYVTLGLGALAKKVLSAFLFFFVKNPLFFIFIGRVLPQFLSHVNGREGLSFFPSYFTINKSNLFQAASSKKS